MKITKSQLKRIIKEELMEAVDASGQPTMIEIGDDIELARSERGEVTLQIWVSDFDARDAPTGVADADLDDVRAKELVAALVKMFGESILPGAADPDYEGVDFLEDD